MGPSSLCRLPYSMKWDPVSLSTLEALGAHKRKATRDLTARWGAQPGSMHWDTNFCPYQVFLLETGGEGTLPREDGWPR